MRMTPEELARAMFAELVAIKEEYLGLRHEILPKIRDEIVRTEHKIKLIRELLTIEGVELPTEEAS